MRPSRNEVLMEQARVTAKRATCNKQSVGVVIARDGRILVTGYNGAPAGMEHCNHQCNCDFTITHRADDTPVKVLHQDDCEWGVPCTNAVHAEANAIAYAARWGIRIENADLFTTFTPCLACGQLVVNAGIKRVVYAEVHRDQRGLDLCGNAGIEVVHESMMDLIK